MRLNQWNRAALAGFLAFAFGCGGALPPTEQMATTQAAIRGASEAGAEGTPQAALHLKLANEQLTKAKEMMAEDNNEPAERALLRAEADAELARSLARQVQAAAEAEEANQELMKLKKK